MPSGPLKHTIRVVTIAIPKGMHIGTRNALTFASGTDILNVLLRLVQTTAIMLRPVTSQVNFIEKKKKFQLIAMH